MRDSISNEKIDVRGTTISDEIAPLPLQLAAWSTDVLLGLTLFFGLYASLVPFFFPSIGQILIFFVIWILVLALLKNFLGTTLGLFVWRLKLTHRGRFSDLILPSTSAIRQVERIQLKTIGPASILLIVVAAGTLWKIQSTVTKSPLMVRAIKKELLPHVPASVGDGQSQWMTMPFYYLSGAWPKAFLGRPVLYNLPYSKGPPKRFTGKIIARWNMPSTQLTIEGPKTRVRSKISEIKNCFEKIWNVGCFQIRNEILQKYLHEIQQWKPTAFTIQWFEVQNPVVAQEEWPKGIYLSASNKERAQDRYIIFNHSGAQQALTLSRPKNSSGDQAKQLLEKTVRSLRVFEHVSPGRALVDQSLIDVRLSDLNRLKDSLSLVKKLAEVQGLLVAKISVEPKSHQAYYHLGGTALMLAKHAADLRTRRTQVLSPQMAMMVSDWSAASKPLVQSAYLYANDVNPKHPNTTRLQNLWIEAQKL